MTEDETWTQFRDLEANARLRNAVELFMKRLAPAGLGTGAGLCPTGALPGEDATAEMKLLDLQPKIARRAAS